MKYHVGQYLWTGNGLVQVYKIDEEDKKYPYKCKIFSQYGEHVDSDWYSEDKLMPIDDFADDFIITNVTQKVVRYLHAKYKQYQLARIILNYEPSEHNRSLI